MELSLGARLRAQREHQQLALATIADETKINVALLEGLERDDVSRWPGGLFRRAYVRTYAQKIGLDPEQVVREFIALHPDPVQEASPVEAIAQNAQAKRPRTRIGLMLAGLALRRPQRPQVRRTIAPETFSVASDAPLAMTEAAAADPVSPVESLSTANESVASDGFRLRAEVPSVGHDGAIDCIIQEEDPAPRLMMVPSFEPGVEIRRDLRALERNIVSAARLCTRIARARDDRDLSSALEEAVVVLEARGAILWVWDPDRDSLGPVLANGYSEELLTRLPDVSRHADNAIAEAFRFGQKQVVRGTADATGAIVAPLVTPDGCAGVLALEYADGIEQHELVQALVTIITAQLSTLFATPPQVIEEDWTRQDRSLVAS
jgi:transcriptional regulator with XRE-family HTH domain